MGGLVDSEASGGPLCGDADPDGRQCGDQKAKALWDISIDTRKTDILRSPKCRIGDSNRMKLCIDLCSGLGGFSRAFVDAGWDVITVDIERKFRPTIQANVMNLPFREDLMADVVLASPPCQTMSVASVSRHWISPQEPCPETIQAITLFHHIRDWMKTHARKHLRENPMGMARNKIVYGRPDMTLNLSDFGTVWKKRTDFWGNIMLGLIPARRDWEPAPRGSKGGVQGVRDPAKRALLPYGLSQAILQAVESDDPR